MFKISPLYGVYSGVPYTGLTSLTRIINTSLLNTGKTLGYSHLQGSSVFKRETINGYMFMFFSFLFIFLTAL